MQILGKAQVKVFSSDEDIERFIAFARPIMDEERRRMNSFSNKASKQIEEVLESVQEKDEREKKIQ